MKKQISIFGKSTVSQEKKSYQLIEELSYELVKNDYACVHGGYAGGIMQAVADGANKASIKFNKEQRTFNRGIPEKRFDEKWPRVPKAHFDEASEDIYSRLKSITLSDMFIAAPDGGDGTLLETDIVIHENTINELLGIKVKPIIFIEGEDRKWSKIFQNRLENLDISKRNVSDYPWVYFVQYSENETNASIIEQVLEIITKVT